MKTYLVKDKIINIKTLETHVYYLGKDGYVHGEDAIEYCDGYTRPIYAQNYIERELRNGIVKKIDNNHAIESDIWLHIYDIVEYVKA